MTRERVIYRRYQDSKGRTYDQVVAPSKYRGDLLHLPFAAMITDRVSLKR